MNYKGWRICYKMWLLMQLNHRGLARGGAGSKENASVGVTSCRVEVVEGAVRSPCVHFPGCYRQP